MPDPTAIPDLVGSTEAIEILSIDRSTLSRWAAAGRITPVQRLSGENGAMLFLRADVEALAAALTRQAQAKATQAAGAA
jgi:predicted site-specific integrase-resolvase